MLVGQQVAVPVPPVGQQVTELQVWGMCREGVKEV